MEEYVAKATGSLSNTIRAKNNEYYGFYRGTVVNNEDTESRGRCKIFIRGVYNEEFKEESGKLLPWAEPCQPLFCGGMGDDGANGTFQCPDMGSTVWCFFENSDIMKPVFFGQTTDENGKFSTKHCTLKWEKMHIDLFRGADSDKETGGRFDIKNASSSDYILNNGSYDDSNTSNIISISADTDINEIARSNDFFRFAGHDINDVAKTNDYNRYAYHDINDTAYANDCTRTAGNDIKDVAFENISSIAGNSIYISASGGSISESAATQITINAKGSNVNIIAANSVMVNGVSEISLTAPKITITGDTTIDGTCTIKKDTTIDGEATIKNIAYSTHVHMVATEGAPTGVPQ